MPVRLCVAFLVCVVACAAALSACGPPEAAGLDDDGLALGSLPDPPTMPPEWAADAVWYQIVPERFANGDPGNDPTPASTEGAWPRLSADSLRDAGWQPSDWTSDWYAPAAWETRLRPDDRYATLPARRYGGDLQGVIDRIDYLDSLGINAIYLTPVNDSPSADKYDARSYRHVDPHFGPDPGRDRDQIELEDPADPETWSTTAADSLLLELIAAVHERDMRIVLDYAFTHTGTQFWAFQDVLDNGRASDYAGWYRIDAWDDPATPDSEFGYTGWSGVPAWPAFRTVDASGDPERGVPLGGDLAPGPKGHAFAVALRWLDPDGDGDPADGVDGFRLDAAEQVPLGFWRDLRRLTKAVNPDAILVGEIGGPPEALADPAPYLGDAFDAVMHYRPFVPLRQLVDPSGPQISPVQAAAELGDLYGALSPDHLVALMSVSGSHDTPRLGTTMANAGVPYNDNETPRARPGYLVGRPDSAAMRSVRLLRLLQVTLPGAPQVYYGDEVGMWGADDPDNRKPMLWPDLRYAPEAALPGGTARSPEAVAPDRDLLAFTRSALSLRTAYPGLFSRGTLQWQPEADLLRFTRRSGDLVATVVVNLAPSPRATGVPVSDTTIPLVAGDRPRDQGGAYVIGSRSGAVFLRSREDG